MEAIHDDNTVNASGYARLYLAYGKLRTLDHTDYFLPHFLSVFVFFMNTNHRKDVSTTWRRAV